MDALSRMMSYVGLTQSEAQSRPPNPHGSRDGIDTTIMQGGIEARTGYKSVDALLIRWESQEDGGETIDKEKLVEHHIGKSLSWPVQVLSLWPQMDEKEFSYAIKVWAEQQKGRDSLRIVYCLAQTDEGLNLRKPRSNVSEMAK